MLRQRAQTQLREVPTVLPRACGELAQLSTLAVATTCPGRWPLSSPTSAGCGTCSPPPVFKGCPLEHPAGAGAVPGQGFMATQENSPGARRSETAWGQGDLPQPRHWHPSLHIQPHCCPSCVPTSSTPSCPPITALWCSPSPPLQAAVRTDTTHYSNSSTTPGCLLASRSHSPTCVGRCQVWPITTARRRQ